MTKTLYKFLEIPCDIELALKNFALENRVAVDLEADGLFSYRDKVCLIQIAGKQGVTIIDPLKGAGALSGFKRLLEEREILKVFHGGDYDIRLLKRDLGIKTVNIFDTMIASQLLGKEAIGLGALLEEYFDIHTDKKFQKANWSERPISGEMLEYAALDVSNLIELADILKGELKAKGRLPWAEEEFSLMEQAEPPPQKEVSSFDVKGAGKFTPRQHAILQCLLEVRDRVAAEWDRPPFKVISNKVFMEWAQNPPKNRREIIETRGAAKNILAKLSDQLLAVIKSAESLPAEKLPKRPQFERRPPLSGEEKKCLSALKEARNKVSEELGIGGGLIVNSATLENLARLEKDGAKELLEESLKGWQREVVGDILLNIIQS